MAATASDVAGASGVIETTQAPQLVEHLAVPVSFTAYDVAWVPMSARYVAVGLHAKGTGAIEVRELGMKADSTTLKVEKKAGFKCCTFGASALQARHLATGDYDGRLAVWDLERADTPLYSAQAHNGLVNAMAGVGGLGVGSGAPELATCGRDGSVRVWDVRVKDPVLVLKPAEGESARDCWTVAFGNAFNESERMLAAGYDNGDVKLFDMRMSALRWETNVGNGVVNMQFDRPDIDMNKLVVTTLESKFHVFDLRTQHPDEGFACLTERAHKSTVWLGKHLPQNRDVFVTTGGNGGVNLYKYGYPVARSARDEKGHARGVMGSLDLLNSRVIATQPIVAWDWSSDKAGLAVAASLDQHVRVLIATKLDKL